LSGKGRRERRHRARLTENSHLMRWYVSENRKASGPFTEERIAIMIQWGKISRKALLGDESHATWVPITRTHFAPLFPQHALEKNALLVSMRAARAWLSGRPRPSFVALSVVAAALMAAITVHQSETDEHSVRRLELRAPALR
jgi:hypothetical protein